jgi:hypothetical protein
VKHGDPHGKDEAGVELEGEDSVGEVSGAADADVEASGQEDEVDRERGLMDGYTLRSASCI